MKEYPVEKSSDIKVHSYLSFKRIEAQSPAMDSCNANMNSIPIAIFSPEKKNNTNSSGSCSWKAGKVSSQGLGKHIGHIILRFEDIDEICVEVYEFHVHVTGKDR